MDDHHALSLINNVDRVDHLHTLVRQDLRDLGIKLPKSKKIKKFLNTSRRNCFQNESSTSSLFGESLSHLPCTFIPRYGYVPQFLLDASKVIDANLDSEGIFRKSGSVNRQKELRAAVEAGMSMESSNPYDVAVLIKQFFRELPEAIFLSCYLDALVKCFQLSPDKEPKKAILNLCLLLPIENIGALRFTLHMLHRVASNWEKNKMHASNLSVVMAPNLMHSKVGQIQKMNATEEKVLHTTRNCIVELLIRNWDLVGSVGSQLRQQLNLMCECFGTDDELNASDDNTLEDSKDIRVKKRRKRSGSLTGLVNSIAHGLSKLRRSTDGRNMSTASYNTSATYPGEMSMASNTSTAASDSVFEDSQNAPVISAAAAATPCVIGKRRASGDTVPFSANKKKAILSNLPQKSALASTPFTPASTVKRSQYHHDDNYMSASQTPRLNATTTGAQTKTSRKKLNLFNTPGSNRKMKRQNSDSCMASPRQKKGKSIFRRLSGSRAEKDESDNHSESSNKSPRSTVSEPALHDQTGCTGLSASSNNLQDEFFEDESQSYDRMDYDDGEYVRVNHVRGYSADRSESRLKMSGRSKSVDSPGLKRGQPNTVTNGLYKSGIKKRAVNKLDIGEPCPIIVPVVPDAIEVKADGELRRSRRDEFEEEKRLREQHRHGSKKSTDQSGSLLVPDLDKSIASQLDTSLMEAVLPPPQGFGDQSVLMEGIVVRSHSENDDESEEVNVESDGESDTGFSTISGGTVMVRTVSGRYSPVIDPTSTSCSSLISSASSVSLQRPGRTVLQASVSEDSLLSVESKLSDQPSQILSCSTDSGKGSILGDCHEGLSRSVEHGVDKGTFVAVNKSDNPEGEYVVLRQEDHKCPHPNESSDGQLNKTRGMTMLCDNYKSEEDSSSPTRMLQKSQVDRDDTLGSLGEDLRVMPTQPNVSHQRKCFSSQDLQSAPKLQVPSRSQSLYLSPGKRFNFKPRIEVTQETHNLLSRAGYIQALKRSPKRSAQREELMHSLRSSRLHSSMRSSKSVPCESVSDPNVHLSSKDASISSYYERLSLRGEDEYEAFARDHEGDIGKRVSQFSAKMSSMTLDHTQKADDKAKLSDEGQQSQTVEHVETVTHDSSIDIEDEGRMLSQNDVSNEDVQETEMSSPNREAVHEESETASSSVCKLKDSDKSMTLSGFLDNQLTVHGPLRIKRAEISLPKHDSIANIKDQKAGLVAESVRHFTEKQKKLNTIPSIHKRGTSPIRIPTIFAKSEDKARHYREIASFMRERIGTKEFLQWPQVPPTPGKSSTHGNPENSDSETSSIDESLQEGNVTVLEAELPNRSCDAQDNISFNNNSVARTTHPLNTTVPANTHSLNSAVSANTHPLNCSLPAGSTHHPSRRQSVDLSESLIQTINEVCTPRADRLPPTTPRGKEQVKSPLQESTNTAEARSPGTANNCVQSNAGQTPRRMVLQGESTRPASSSRPHRPQIKRLKHAGSPRRRHAKSPKGRLHSPGKSTTAPKFSAVSIHLNDEHQ